MSGATLLGGRVVHEQASDGHRSGIEPVLLAASLPARAGERVLEGGSGAGTALLCLAARVSGVRGVGVERDAGLVALAQRNAAANGFAEIGFVAADLLTWQGAERFDHAMANPPWHAPAGTPSADAAREAARRAGPGLIAGWARALAAPLRHHGTLTLVVGAGVLAEALAGLTDAGCGGLAVLPLWPREGVAARLVLLRGVKGHRGPSRMLPGLVLHMSGSGYTAAAEAVLRHGAALEFATA